MNQLVKTTDLLTIDPKHFVAETYQPFTEALENAIAKAPTLTYEISTKQGMTVAKEGRAIFRDIRIALEKKRAAAKAPILEIGKLLDSRAKEIVQRIEPFEDQFDNDIKAEEARTEAEKAAKAKAEAERQAAIQQHIDDLRNIPARSVTNSSKVIGIDIEDLQNTELPESLFGDRLGEAVYIRDQSITQLKAMYEGKLAQEELQAQQEAARLESERVARELAAQRLAEEKAQREAMAAQAAELARQEAEFNRRSRELAEAEAKVKAAQESILAAERMKMEAESQAKIDAEVMARNAQFRAEQEAIAKANELIPTVPTMAEDHATNIEQRRKDAQIRDQARPVFSRRPPRADIISLVANHFGADVETAARWMHEEFSGVAA